ncbi:flavodoxin family protein [Paenibacillus jilunlii]|uniref:Flavodoxin n=1 Tax=Paenibacillus jilunlii TaxID=682956 RepID=A0A1G9FUN0_9BACL|nr:hypothetical protein [Paenibacillus jilunlii]KWX71240.1 hypothetical protein AML91_23640 [Paenibacillus jilunlii]SDK92100.1 hypothetical protein SAMN05216191_10198 [Paenibacillus jilunlii]
MNIAVISYSYTGNNEALAGSVAKELSAEHIQISEPKTRTMGSIALDMMFSRTPQVQPAPKTLGNYDLILFFGPVWMGHVAAPLRAYLKYLKSHPQRYGFLSISGGADGTNPKLGGELRKRAGAAPAVLIDLHIADLLPNSPKTARKDTSAYRLTDGDINQLTHTMMKTIEDVI